MVSLAQNKNSEKHVKNDSTILLEFFCVKKPLEKTPKYSRNEMILKIGHRAKVIAFAKTGQFGSKIKIKKNMRLRILYSF